MHSAMGLGMMKAACFTQNVMSCGCSAFWSTESLVWASLCIYGAICWDRFLNNMVNMSYLCFACLVTLIFCMPSHPVLFHLTQFPALFPKSDHLTYLGIAAYLFLITSCQCFGEVSQPCVARVLLLPSYVRLWSTHCKTDIMLPALPVSDQPNFVVFPVST